MSVSAITGLGIVSSLGSDVESFSKALFAGACSIGDISDITAPDQRVKIGAPIRDFDPTAHFDRRSLIYLDRFSQFGAVAARQAWRQCGIADGDVSKARIGVSMGTSVSGLDILDAGFRRILLDGASPDPFTVPMTMGSAPTSRIAQEFGVRGPSFGINSACASTPHAVLFGHRLIAAGVVDMFIAGGTDSSFSDGFLRAWHSLRILAPEPCRPFSADRKGISLGEGAAVLVLESMEFARRRGARIQATLLGGGMSSDACGVLTPDAAGMEAAMRAALDDAGLSPADIDYVNAHGTGTKANDKAEAAALEAVFGAGGVKVSATKSQIGHCLGASGALEAVATIAALDSGTIPPTLNMTALDDDCRLDIVANAAIKHPMRRAMSNSFGFGGLNGVLIFGAAER